MSQRRDLECDFSRRSTCPCLHRTETRILYSCERAASTTSLELEVQTVGVDLGFAQDQDIAARRFVENLDAEHCPSGAAEAACDVGSAVAEAEAAADCSRSMTVGEALAEGSHGGIVGECDRQRGSRGRRHTVVQFPAVPRASGELASSAGLRGVPRTHSGDGSLTGKR